MKNSYAVMLITLAGALTSYQAYAATCPFDSTQTCTLARDILNDKSGNKNFYAATNYKDTSSGELDTYNAALATSYQDRVNAPGQIMLQLKKISTGVYQSSEIMTRANLNAPPYNSPTSSVPWTTQGIAHGYLAVTVKMPWCVTSDDGACQRHTQSETYNAGLWPAVWLLPTNDASVPTNGQINIAEAYPTGSCFNTAPSTLHFNGTAATCVGGDCVKGGFLVGTAMSQYALSSNYHTYGFEWQPDPAHTGAQLLTGYLDNVKIWGPTSTAILPADGANAFARGFSDPNGGFYLIVNLAIGGPFAGAPNAHLDTATMFIQSIKAYNVGVTPPASNCQPPINIQSMVSPNKTQATIAWEAPTTPTDPILNYQVNDWNNRVVWTGSTPTDRVFQDQTLPGTSGSFTYNIYTNCTTGLSSGVTYVVEDLNKGEKHE
jgi:beta-glucanase (GH16 family)